MFVQKQADRAATAAEGRLPLMERLMKLANLLFIIILLSATAGNNFAAPVSKGDAKSTSKMEASLNLFLREYSDGDPTDSYPTAFVDLNDDGLNEAIVYVRAQGTCGSGGCRTLILRWNGNSWSIVTDVSITKLPIRVLATKSHGWKDISVVVQGGGIMQPYESVLRFNGTTYPDNPTLRPAKKAKRVPKGKSVIHD